MKFLFFQMKRSGPQRKLLRQQRRQLQQLPKPGTAPQGEVNNESKPSIQPSSHLGHQDPLKISR